MLESWPHAIVVRTSPLFGPWDRYNFIYDVLATLQAGRPFLVANDCRVTSTYVPDLVHRALDLTIDGESGIWHLANEGGLHWSEFARRVAKSVGLDAKLVVVADESATSTELVSRRGPPLPPLHSAIARFVRDREAA